MVVALVAIAGSAVLSVAVPRQAQPVTMPLAATVKAAADTCTDRLDHEVPLGAKQCIMHDWYVCTPNQVWKKTGETC